MNQCTTCYLLIKDEDTLEGSLCPVCQGEVIPGCSEDHICTCISDVTSGARYCQVCGEPVCPCGSHDVEVISRITGYLQPTYGWNAGKQQELKDRQRVTI